MSNFRDLVIAEKTNARNAFGGLASMHEIYGVLSEELHEFFLEVIKKPDERDANNVTKELVQLASVAEMAAEDMGLVEKIYISDGRSLYQDKYEQLKEKVTEFLNASVVGQDNRLQRTKEQRPVIVESTVVAIVAPKQAYQDLVDIIND